MTRAEIRMRWKNQLPAAAVLCLTALCLDAFAPAAVAEDKRSHQWYLDAMQAERMWRTSTGEGVTVAVIDSGVDGSVPELRGQLLAGKDFSGEGRGAHYDGEGHGTSMAMVIAGKRGGQNTWGLAPGSKMLPIRAQGKWHPQHGEIHPLCGGSGREGHQYLPSRTIRKSSEGRAATSG